MSLNGIDVASYQAGLDPAKVPMDFCIVKATQGTTYVNPDFTRMAYAAKKAGRLLGIYHYAGGGSATAEADYFLKTVHTYIGKAILALDWEGEQNPVFGTGRDVDWCYEFCMRVKAKTGATPFIYMSKSVCRRWNWRLCSDVFPLWAAQYASNSRTGYQKDPWTDGSGFGSWEKALIYQYSSHGSLSVWSGDLDLDIAYMTADDWLAYASGKPPEVKFPEKSDTDLGIEIWADRYGAGDARRKALSARYNGAQAEAERLNKLHISEYMKDLKAYEKKHGALFN